MQTASRHWIVQYFMFAWLYQNEKFELINVFRSNNYFLSRECNSFKFKLIEDPTYLSLFIGTLLKSDDCLTALHGLYLRPLLPEKNDFDFLEHNVYIQSLTSECKIDYIRHTLKKDFSIFSPELFFNEQIWQEKELYKELSDSFRFFFAHRTTDPSKSLLNLNAFNNIVFDKICEFLKIQNKSTEYGVNLNSGCIEDRFPIVNKHFTEINECRNQKTEAHPYDRHGNLRIRVNLPELEKLIKKQKNALQEICDFHFSA